MSDYEIKYRVYKVGGVRCVRKFDSMEEAKAWCWTREPKKGHEGYRIEWQYENESTPRSIYL